jgi:hypothetical protein
MWKHIFVFLVMLLAFAFSGAMLESLVGIASPWMGLMMFFAFLGLARIAEPLYQLKLPGNLKRLRSWEVKGAVYQKLAVPRFGKLLRNTPLRFLNSSVYLSRESREPLPIRPQIESAEAIHFWSAVLLLPYMVFCCLHGQWVVAGVLLMLQALWNVYPIMHLRAVRARLDRAIDRARSRDDRFTVAAGCGLKKSA